ncbi:hypothetical protein Tco_1360576 [Tanacetum coccineum]
MAYVMNMSRSIHIYWASVLPFANHYYKGINKLMNGFMLISATKKDTLWVKWVHSVKLRGKSIWEIDADINDSWGWKNLLSIRDLIRNNVRLSSDLSVSDMICNEQWRWPIKWMERFPMITNLDVPAINTDNDDKIVWRTKKGRDLNFSVSMVNTDLNDQAPDSRCPYPFTFKCSFVRNLWNKSPFVIADIHTNSLDLNEIVHILVSNGNGSNIKSIIRRLAFAASIYSIWQKRNGRIFKESKRSCDEVFKSMIEMIKNKLHGITVKDSLAVRDIERRWAITCKKSHSGKYYMN